MKKYKIIKENVFQLKEEVNTWNVIFSSMRESLKHFKYLNDIMKEVDQVGENLPPGMIEEIKSHGSNIVSLMTQLLNSLPK